MSLLSSAARCNVRVHNQKNPWEPSAPRQPICCPGRGAVNKGENVTYGPLSNPTTPVIDRPPFCRPNSEAPSRNYAEKRRLRTAISPHAAVSDNDNGSLVIALQTASHRGRVEKRLDNAIGFPFFGQSKPSDVRRRDSCPACTYTRTRISLLSRLSQCRTRTPGWRVLPFDDRSLPQAKWCGPGSQGRMQRSRKRSPVRRFSEPSCCSRFSPSASVYFLPVCCLVDLSVVCGLCDCQLQANLAYSKRCLAIGIKRPLFQVLRAGQGGQGVCLVAKISAPLAHFRLHPLPVLDQPPVTPLPPPLTSFCSPYMAGSYLRGTHTSAFATPSQPS